MGYKYSADGPGPHGRSNERLQQPIGRPARHETENGPFFSLESSVSSFVTAVFQSQRVDGLESLEAKQGQSLRNIPVTGEAKMSDAVRVVESSFTCMFFMLEK